MFEKLDEGTNVEDVSITNVDIAYKNKKQGGLQHTRRSSQMLPRTLQALMPGPGNNSGRVSHLRNSAKATTVS